MVKVNGVEQDIAGKTLSEYLKTTCTFFILAPRYIP